MAPSCVGTFFCFFFLILAPPSVPLCSCLLHPHPPFFPQLTRTRSLPSHLPSRILSQTARTSPPCPIDFSYLKQFTWAPSLCQSQLSGDKTPCCTSLLNTLGIGLAQYLRDTGYFELPNNATVFACLEEYHTALHAAGLTQNLIGECFTTPSMFIRSPLLCAGIETTDDWQERLGSTSMDISCRGDLSQTAACQVCAVDAYNAITKVTQLTNDHSSCVYFGFLYAAGVVNSYGPKNASTAFCLLAVQSSFASPAEVSAKSQIALYFSMGVGIVLFVGCASAVFLWLWIRKRSRMIHKEFVERNSLMLQYLLKSNAGAVWFNHEDVKTATNNFSQTNVIGIGGFATVYKGNMLDGSQIAVKKIKNCTPEGDAEFLNEVEVIRSVRHRNLVLLRGCCVASNTNDGHQRLLVYDYMCNGSLEDYLFGGRKPPLAWADRRRIAVGTARGIAYLHNGVQPAIIHRDIKAHNILLDERLNAKVADFGLAKITAEGMTHLSTRVAGTQGYLAPEYALYGRVTEKSDVYSFGVLLLVLMSGRKALDVKLESPSQYLVTDWAWEMVKEGNVKGILEERMREGEDDDGEVETMVRFVLVGILCAHLLVAFRPTMAQVLRMLEGDEEVPGIPDRPLPLNCGAVRHCELSRFSSGGAAECSYSLTDLLR